MVAVEALPAQILFAGGLFLVLLFQFGYNALLTVALILLLYYFKKNCFSFIYITYKTFPKDIVYTWRYLKILYFMHKIVNQKTSIGSIFQQQLKKHPHKTMLQTSTKSWTFQEAEVYTNRLANYFKSQGISRGDSLALFVESSSEYVLIWLALAKLGAISALVNTNLTRTPLIHTLTLTKPRAIIFSSKLSQALDEVRSSISIQKYYQLNISDEAPILEGASDLKEALTTASTESPDAEIQNVTPWDTAFYIFTSGTTGLPKAAIISHLKAFYYSVSVYTLCGFREDEIIYCCMPLYHTAGCTVNTIFSIIFGTTIHISNKFSASNFWKDCAKYNCTVAQYIGEICQYLLAVPPGHPSEKNHKVRMLFGNGLKSQIWTEIMERFGVPEINELYGSTEGISILLNNSGIPGKVASIPRFLHNWYGNYLVRFDPITNQPLRDQAGFCIRCKPNEPGIFLERTESNFINKFLGYSNILENEKKLINNVECFGDVFYNSGDVMTMDEFGYFSFKDRLGDNFRWKGENVAITEVETVIKNLLQMKDVVVYGAEVPKTDGRCGMVAIVCQENELNLDDFSNEIVKSLPPYAVPRFIRLLKEMPLTETFKIKRNVLKDVGFNINKTTDKLYFYDIRIKKYVHLDMICYEKIMSGNVRL